MNVTYLLTHSWLCPEFVELSLYYADKSNVCKDSYISYNWWFKDENVYTIRESCKTYIFIF